jgi:putative endonuclease
VNWCCYILRCADGTLYTGISNDLERRLAAHNTGTASKYTRARLPVTLLYSERHSDRSSASRREAQLKRLPRKAKLDLVSSLRRKRKIK